MNFTFQFGEFLNDTPVWVSIIGALLGALVSGLAGLGVYKLGERRQQKKETKRILDLENYFFTGIQELIPSIQDYILQIDRQIDALKKKEIQQSQFYLHVGLQYIEDLKSIPQIELFAIYVSSLGLNQTIFRGCLNSLKIIEDNKRVLVSIRANYRESTFDFGKTIESQLRTLKELIIKFLSQEEKIGSSLYQGVNSISNNYLRHTSSDEIAKNPFLAEQILVEPLINLFRENYAEAEQEMSLVNITVDLQLTFKKLHAFRTHYINQFSVMKKGMESSLVGLNNFLEGSQKLNRKILKNFDYSFT